MDENELSFTEEQQSVEELQPPTESVPIAESRSDESMRRELEWYKLQHQQAMEAVRDLQRRLEEYETAAMDDEERAKWELQRQQQELEAQRRMLEEAQYAQSLYTYYSRYVPPEAIKGSSPSEWQASVLEYLRQRIAQLQQERDALKRAAVPGQNAPRVGTPGAGAPKPRKSVWELSPEERRALLERAKAGMTTPDDYPSIE